MMMMTTPMPTPQPRKMGGAYPVAGDFLWPTRMMRLAVSLHAQHGLDDAEIGRRLSVSREWSCKLRGEYRRRMEAIELACAEAGGDATIIRRLIKN